MSHQSLNGPATLGTHDVGVIAPAEGCPMYAPSLGFHMDNEDSDEASYVTGWVGGASVDEGGNTTFPFCRIDGTKFRSLQGVSSLQSNYALLKLGATCPPGSVEFTRHFDNEDGDNLNSHWGEISPNVINTDTTLSFCLFMGGGSLATRLPILEFEYGVFATADFALATATGHIFNDDEDTRNANSYTADPAWQWAAKNIITEGANTTLRVVRAGLSTSCGDGICNGLETELKCAADCTICGNGECGPRENASSCIYDCGTCGDGYCGHDEGPWSCNSDCGFCGDRRCDPGNEDEYSCNFDCGYCGDGICGPNEDSYYCAGDCQ